MISCAMNGDLIAEASVKVDLLAGASVVEWMMLLAKASDEWLPMLANVATRSSWLAILTVVEDMLVYN